MPADDQLREALVQAERGTALLRRLAATRKQQKKESKEKRHCHEWQREAVALETEANALSSQILQHVSHLAASFSLNETCPNETITKKKKKRLGGDSTRAHDLLLEKASNATANDKNDDARRQGILAEARKVLAQSSTSENNTDTGGGEQARDSIWKELSSTIASQEKERLWFKREVYAQVMGTRQVVNATLREAGKTTNRSELLEMGELLFAVRQGLNNIENELHTESVQLMQEVSIARSAVNRGLRKADTDTTSMRPQKLTKRDFSEFLVSNEEEQELLKAVCTAEHVLENAVTMYNKQLADLESQREKNAKEHKRAIQTETWFGDAEHSMFVKLYREIILRGRGYGCFFERAETDLRQKSRGELENHLRWFEEKRTLKQQYKDLMSTAKRTLAELENKHLSIIRTVLSNVESERIKRGEKEQHEQQRAEVHARLEQQRAIAAERLRALEEEQQERESQRLEEEARAREIEEMERRRKHALVERYKQEQAFLEAMANLHQEQYDAAMKDLRKEASKQNKVRVEFRHDERLRRLEEERQRLQEEELEREEQQHRLEQIRKSVPYFYKLQDIVPSRERVLSSTFSSAVVPDAAYQNYNQQGLFKNNGFSDDRVCGDVRFRVIEALRSKGLQNSSYAHTLLKTMSAATTAHKNLNSTFSFCNN